MKVRFRAKSLKDVDVEAEGSPDEVAALLTKLNASVIDKVPTPAGILNSILKDIEDDIDATTSPFPGIPLSKDGLVPSSLGSVGATFPAHLFEVAPGASLTITELDAHKFPGITTIYRPTTTLPITHSAYMKDWHATHKVHVSAANDPPRRWTAKLARGFVDQLSPGARHLLVAIGGAYEDGGLSLDELVRRKVVTDSRSLGPIMGALARLAERMEVPNPVVERSLPEGQRLALTNEFAVIFLHLDAARWPLRGAAAHLK